MDGQAFLLGAELLDKIFEEVRKRAVQRHDADPFAWILSGQKAGTVNEDAGFSAPRHAGQDCRLIEIRLGDELLVLMEVNHPLVKVLAQDKIQLLLLLQLQEMIRV